MILHPITVDDRERRPSAEEMVEALRQLRVGSRVGRLPDNGGGDFQWVCEPEDDGEWVAVTVEHKSVNDLLASAEDGRLANFVGTPSTANNIRALLVEMTDAYRGNNPEALDNMLASVQMHGIVVLRAERGHLAERLAAFWKWTGKERHGSFNRPALPATQQVYLNDEERAAVRFIMGIPGWGEDRARSIYRHCGSLWAVLDIFRTRDLASVRDIRGVGSGLVNGAADFLERQRHPA